MHVPKLIKIQVLFFFFVNKVSIEASTVVVQWHWFLLGFFKKNKIK